MGVRFGGAHIGVQWSMVKVLCGYSLDCLLGLVYRRRVAGWGLGGLSVGMCCGDDPFSGLWAGVFLGVLVVGSG